QARRGYRGGAGNAQALGCVWSSEHLRSRLAVMAARGFITPMSTRFKERPRFQAWEEAEMRSVAFGVSGFLVVGAFQAVGAIPTIYRTTLAPVSGMVSAFLIAPNSIACLLSQTLDGGHGRSRTFLDSTSRSKSVVSES